MKAFVYIVDSTVVNFESAIGVTTPSIISFCHSEMAIHFQQVWNVIKISELLQHFIVTTYHSMCWYILHRSSSS